LTIESILARIAKEHMQIETLQTRNHDALDFHTVAVWEAKSALQAAYDAGRAEGRMHVRADVVSQTCSDVVTTIQHWWIETHHLIVMTAIAYAALC